MQLEQAIFHEKWKFRYVARLLKQYAPHEAVSEELDEQIKKNLTEIGKRVLKYTDTYDDNVIVDGNEIKLESQLRKEIRRKEKEKYQVGWL